MWLKSKNYWWDTGEEWGWLSECIRCGAKTKKNLGEEKKKEKTLSRNVINTSVPPQGVRCVIAKKKYEPKGR